MAKHQMHVYYMLNFYDYFDGTVDIYGWDIPSNSLLTILIAEV